MLHNVTLKIVNLNTPTLCLSFCNRMAPPMPHQLVPLFDVEYDDPLLVPDDEVHYVVGLSSLRPTYVERILSSKTCRLINQWKCCMATYRPFICFMFVLYNTCSFVQHRQQLNCSWPLSVRALTCHVLWRDTDAPWALARQNHAYGALEPGLWHDKWLRSF